MRLDDEVRMMYVMYYVWDDAAGRALLQVPDVSDKWYEPSPYVVDLPLRYSTGVIATNPAFWNKLPEDVRTTLENKVIPEAIKWARAKLVEIDTQAYKVAAAGGAKIYTPTPSELQDYIKACKPLYDIYGPKVGWDIINQARKIGGTEELWAKIK